MNFYPVLIPTLCRYEHFKRCLISLEKNPLAKETTVYIALDYPLKDEHWDGYEKIKVFLNGKFNFKELVIIKREKNFGAYINCDCAKKDLYKEYNAIIISEDDNEFSPNFLEYMNVCLDKYENDNSVIAIGGFSFPVKWKTDGNNVLRLRPFCCAWGFGVWKNRKDWLDNISPTMLWNKIRVVSDMVELIFKYPSRFCRAIETTYSGQKLRYDAGYSIYMFFFGKYIIYPVISKVKNYGFDGSGSSDIICNKFTKVEIDSETHFEIKGDDSLFMKNNATIVNKFLGYSKISLLKAVIKYFLLKFKIRKIPSDA